MIDRYHLEWILSLIAILGTLIGIGRWMGNIEARKSKSSPQNGNGSDVNHSFCNRVVHCPHGEEFKRISNELRECINGVQSELSELRGEFRGIAKSIDFIQGFIKPRGISETHLRD